MHLDNDPKPVLNEIAVGDVALVCFTGTIGRLNVHLALDEQSPQAENLHYPRASTYGGNQRQRNYHLASGNQVCCTRDRDTGPCAGEPVPHRPTDTE